MVSIKVNNLTASTAAFTTTTAPRARKQTAGVFNTKSETNK